MHGVCIRSETLLNECTLASNENLALNETLNSKCDLSSLLNNYSVKHQYSIDSNDLKGMVQLSKVKLIKYFDLNSVESYDKDSNELLEIEISKNQGELTHFLYWFRFVSYAQKNIEKENFFLNDVKSDFQSCSSVSGQYAAISFCKQNVYFNYNLHQTGYFDVFFKDYLFYLKFNNFKFKDS